MTDSFFYAKNGLYVNNGIMIVDPTGNTVTVNAATLHIGAGIVNASFFTGQSFDSQNLDGVPGSGYVSSAQLTANLNNYVNQAGLSANVARISAVNNQTLSANATNFLNWDTSVGLMASVSLVANATMSAPTNLANGSLILFIKQSGSGNNKITWNAIFKWPAGVAPTLSTAISATDMLSFIYDGSKLYGSYVIGLA